MDAHHMVAGALVGCLMRRAHEVEVKAEEMQIIMDTTLTKDDELEKELLTLHYVRDEDLVRVK